MTYSNGKKNAMLDLAMQWLPHFEGVVPGSVKVLAPGWWLVVGRSGEWGTVRRYWSICDNGGEVNVEPFNAPNEMVSVAYSHSLTLVDGPTLAYRMAVVMRDEDIDYHMSMADLLEIAPVTLAERATL